MIKTSRLLAAAAIAVSFPAFASVSVGTLQACHLVNPVGIDSPPLLGWVIDSDMRGTMQESYSIKVATDPAMGNIVWESGTVNSSESVNVLPEGFNPQPSTRYYWTVTVTSNHGETATSNPAHFETGLMSSGWSGAKWIKATKDAPVPGGVDPEKVKNYVVEADFEIERIAAGIIWGAIDANNYYMWQFNTENNQPRFRPHRWLNGGASCLANVDIDLRQHKVYHMRIEVKNGGRLAETYIDGRLIDSREGTFPYGNMGFRASSGEQNEFPERAYYDDFKVTDADGTVLFFDDFSTGRNNFSAGIVVDGQLRVQREYSWQTAFTPNSAVKNYTVEAKFTVDQVAAGIIFAGVDNSHYYMWQVNLDSGRAMFRPHRWNGGAALLAENYIGDKIDVKCGKEYTMRIEVSNDGTLARTYIDDILIDERNGEFAYGKVGIRADHAGRRGWERSYYDNLRITDSDTDDILFEEEFSDSDNCGFTKGTVTPDGRLALGDNSETYSWTCEKSSTAPQLHYTIEADMTIARDNSGIIFSHKGNINYFMWAINTANRTRPAVRRHVYSGSSSPVWSDTEITSFTKADLLGTTRRLKLDINGKEVKTYIDGTLVDTFTDTSGTLSLGTVGFRASHSGNEDEQTYWDNLVVTDLSSEDAPHVIVREDFEQPGGAFIDGKIVEFNGSRQLFVNSPVNETKVMPLSGGAAPVFRKEITLPASVVSAKLYTSALGNYNVYINGRRVGHLQPDGTLLYDELMPGWTDYRKKVFYVTHDVTSLLTEGVNAIGAQLSNGWWAGDISHGIYGSAEVAFLGKLVVELANSETLTFVTDTSWQVSNDGPVKIGDIYHGETFDARVDAPWSAPGFTGWSWNGVGTSKQFKGDVVAFEGPAVRIRKELEISPKSITVFEGIKPTGTTHGEINVVETMGNRSLTLKKGQAAIIDFGQNFVGWVHFNVKGASGSMLTFRLSEMLNDKGDASRGDDGPGGTPYLINLRSAKCTLRYILSGAEGGEEFHPSTTFFGFRYVEITPTEDIELCSIVGQPVGTENLENSSLATSHPDVNQLYSNVMWGQRSNFLSIPTDCPQRDERLGWTADTQVFSLAASYNSDVLGFYHKWMGDMRDSQREDGAYPDVAPFNWVGFGAAAWADAGVILPWNVYCMYGDRSIIDENFASMERYMNWVATQPGEGSYKYNGAATTYGDWVAFTDTDRRYISVCYYAYMADIMSRMAQATGRIAEAEKYAALFQAIKTEFATRYMRNGSLRVSTQCAHLMALHFNLLPDEAAREKSRATLRALIANNGYKLNTGFLGTSMLNQTLSEQGMDDLAYTLLLQRECPSWLYSVDQGATTIWERWNSYTREEGFHKDISMNSFNHYAYGAVAEWMYRCMGGIAPDTETPGFRHILLQPSPDNRTNLRGQQRITSVDARFASPYGMILSRWNRRDNGTLDYTVTVPANTTATVRYPLAKNQTKLYESGTPVASVAGISVVETTSTHILLEVGSGTYTFSPDGNGDPSAVTSASINSGVVLTPNPAREDVELIAPFQVESVAAYSLAGASMGMFPVIEGHFSAASLPAGVYLIKIPAPSGLQVLVKLVKL